MFQVGSAEEILRVPLFAELYGYGPFHGRRNIGVHDLLYCRAFFFRDDNGGRAMIIYSDVCTMPDSYAREMREKISQTTGISPDCIALVATHTHSGPCLGNGGIGWGEPDQTFQENWKHLVPELALKAVVSAENIRCVETGKAELSGKLGYNRVEPEKNITDDTIRWARFLREDGSCKLLLHNLGLHGTTMNGEYAALVSSDWMGVVNRMIVDEKLAEMPLYLQGASGDVNPDTTCGDLQNDQGAEVVASRYVKDLKKSLSEGGKKITDLAIRGILRTMEFPVVVQTTEELKRDEAAYREIRKYHADRLREMCILRELGHDFRSFHDLQVIRIGGLSFFFIPGEYFVEDGNALMKRSGAENCFIATVANGNGAYYPSAADMKRYPDIASYHRCQDKHAFGFYEIYGYPCRHTFKYQDHIAAFVADNLITLEELI